MKRANPLDRLSDLLEEELLQASGNELEDIAREWGVDPAMSAEAVDSAFKEALRMHNQAKMQEAKRIRDIEVSRLASIVENLPKDRNELLALLDARLAAMRRDDPTRVTIQHRNLEELTEDGLRSLLRDLSAVDKP